MDQHHTPDQVRTLEQLRAQLHTLCGSLHTMMMKLQYGNDVESMPPWPIVQSTMNDFARTVQAIQTIMASTSRREDADSNERKESNIEFLQSAHVHTLPNFPASAQRDLLYTMLRKKLDNPVEDWFSEITNAARKSTDGVLEDTQLRDLWDWAPVAGNKIVKEALGLPAEGAGEVSEGHSESEEDTEFEDVVQDDGATGDKMEGVQTEDMRGSDILQQEHQRRASVVEREPDIHARRMMDLSQILPFALTGTLGTVPSRPTQQRR